MNKFTSNPLSGVHIGDTGSKKNNAIIGPNGEVLLKRQGIDWSENDQLGYDLLMKSMDYEYQADLLNYQNEYNSPLEQSKRFREAGINPDLQQFSSTPSASSSASAPSTQLNEGAERQRTISIAKSFFDVLPQAVSMYTQMKSSIVDSQMKQVDLALSVDALARHEIGTQFTLDDLSSTISLPAADLSHYRSKRLRRAISDRIFRYVHDGSDRSIAKGIVYDARHGAERHRQDFLGLLSNYGFSLDDDTFIGVLREFNDALFGSQKSANKDKKEYHDTRDFASLAETENKEVGKRNLEADNDILADILSRSNRLMKSDKAGDKLKGGLLFFICFLMQNASVSRSIGPKGNTISFGF